ncbi:hypothetical protein P3T76_012069 [Phytophthora citrophthora]|uniref:Reverse transcriptase domain-containing protein n=1 Tax=Phytophthora citrophthora TaxID=4793 RepID=A0AAD9G610_9STRA|nr:hypothetical protein P3T76_012069 [Phytophthora citrophthora]
MICYLRATTGHMGLQALGNEEPHHFLAFADDCTGLLEDLSAAPEFVSHVETYAKASGLRLNVHKTHLLPFSPLPLDIREGLEVVGWDVVANDGSSVPADQLSISTPLGADGSPVHSLEVSSSNSSWSRCHFAHDCLAVLWYTASVTQVPPDVVQRVKRLCKVFLFKKEISDSNNNKGSMAEEWFYLPTSRGGLGLPEMLAFSHTL